MSDESRVEPKMLDSEVGLARSLSIGLKAVEKSFAPPEQRGIHEIIDEMENVLDLLNSQLQLVKKRMSEFDRLQRNFYNGSKP